MHSFWVTRSFANYLLSLTQNLVYIVSLISFLSFTTETTSGYLNYIDSFTTVFPNESLINVYYFWWTNPNYVTFFLTCFLFFSFFHFYKSLKLVTLVFVFLAELWFNEWRDIWNSNVQINVLTTLVPQVNLLLLNSLNKYHPFILYLSLFSAVAFLSMLTLNFFRSEQFLNASWFREKGVWPTKIIIVNFIALFFGSWWALQEGTWGGWWNWDPSELFGLVPSFVLLRLIHSRDTLSTRWLSTFLYFLSILITFLTYLVLQLNFELISHNFGPKFFFFFNSNLFSFILLIFSFSLLHKSWRVLFLLRLRFFLTNQKSTFFPSSKKISSRTYSQILPFLTLILWIIVSFWDFFNSFLKNFMSLTLTNLEIIGLLNLFLLLMLALLFSSSKITSLVPSSLTSVPSFFSLTSVSLLFLLVHTCLLYVSFLNLLIEDLTIYKWYFTTPTQSSNVGFSYLWSSTNFLTCDSWNVDKATLKFDPQGYITTSWSTANVSNVESGNVFTLILTSTAVNNYYELGSSYVNIFLSIHLPLLSSVTLISLLSITTFANLRKLKLY